MVLVTEDQIWFTGEAIIQDETGLHARPAVKLTKLAKRFQASIEIKGEEGSSWINAKSPNAVMKLRAAHETRLLIRACGDDGELAIDQLVALVRRNFDD